MCGRFTLTATFEQLLDRFDIESFLLEEDFTPNYNVTPSQSVLAIVNNGSINKTLFYFLY